jgi:hypothetical protein
MAYGEGADPRNATLKDATTVSGPGYLLTNDSTNNKLDLTAVTEIAIGVSVGESSRDANQVYETTGATVSYYPLGGVLMVACEASQTFTTGATVYVGGSGLATATAGSNKKLGLYVGEGVTTGSSAGNLVPVMTAGAAIA